MTKMDFYNEIWNIKGSEVVDIFKELNSNELSFEDYYDCIGKSFQNCGRENQPRIFELIDVDKISTALYKKLCKESLKACNYSNTSDLLKSFDLSCLDKSDYLSFMDNLILNTPYQEFYNITDKLSMDLIHGNINLTQSEFFNVLGKVYSNINYSNKDGNVYLIFETLNPINSDLINSNQYMSLAKHAVLNTPNDKLHILFDFIDSERFEFTDPIIRRGYEDVFVDCFKNCSDDKVHKVFTVLDDSFLTFRDYTTVIDSSLKRDVKNVSIILNNLNFNRLDKDEILYFVKEGIKNASIEDIPNIINIVSNKKFHLSKESYEEIVDIGFNKLKKENNISKL